MKKPQWITLIAGILLTAGLFLFGRTVPKSKTVTPVVHSEDDGHDPRDQAGRAEHQGDYAHELRRRRHAFR